MKRNFTNENFEYFLRQSADGLRMRPKAHIWKGISNQISRPRRILNFLIVSLFMLITGISYTLTHTSIYSQEGILNKSLAKNVIGLQTINRTTPVLQIAGKTAEGNYSNPIQRRLFKLSLINENTTFVSAKAYPVTVIGMADRWNATNPSSPTVTDAYAENEIKNKITAQSGFPENKPMEIAYPLSIESVVNSFQKAKTARTRIQFYFTPTISYRKLQEHRNVIRSNVPLGIASYQNNIYNINNAVTQVPKIGLEFGSALKHAISKTLNLRAGLQFNVSRYDVKAFTTPSQLSTIQLNNNSSTAYLNTVTNYSNFNGINSSWLQNLYFQVSAPVGIELKLKGDDNIQFGVASTIQPTYILGERAYLISSDYKTYAQVPGLLNHTNVNTSLETFVSYSTHRYTWQVGPQVRYQIFSSYSKAYSVQEHLLDFGLKIGISPVK